MDGFHGLGTLQPSMPLTCPGWSPASAGRRTVTTLCRNATSISAGGETRSCSARAGPTAEAAGGNLVATTSDGDGPLRIFISHAHADAALVSAFKELLERIFGRTTVAVDYSSDESPGGGIQAGTPWLEWILDKVRTADIVVVVLTPESLNR